MRRPLRSGCDILPQCRRDMLARWRTSTSSAAATARSTSEARSTSNAGSHSTLSARVPRTRVDGFRSPLSSARSSSASSKRMQPRSRSRDGGVPSESRSSKDGLNSSPRWRRSASGREYAGESSRRGGSRYGAARLLDRRQDAAAGLDTALRAYSTDDRAGLDTALRAYSTDGGARLLDRRARETHGEVDEQRRRPAERGRRGRCLLPRDRIEVLVRSAAVHHKRHRALGELPGEFRTP